MTRQVLLADLAIAAVFTIVVLIVAPGLAVVAIFAAVVIAVLVISAVMGRVRGRRKGASPRRR